MQISNGPSSTDGRGHALPRAMRTSSARFGCAALALAGDTIMVGSIQAEQPITFSGTVSGDTMSGTYDASACPPPNTGSWEAVRSG